jgi:hypothetical protein
LGAKGQLGPAYTELDQAADLLSAAADALLNSNIGLAHERLRLANMPALRGVSQRIMGKPGKIPVSVLELLDALTIVRAASRRPSRGTRQRMLTVVGRTKPAGAVHALAPIPDGAAPTTRDQSRLMR